MANNKGYIPDPRSSIENQKIRFSFQFYDTSKKYCLSCWSVKEIHTALVRLKEVNEKSYKEMRQMGYQYHFHEVNWKETTEKNGFPNPQVNSLQPFQFALLSVNNQKTRVFGAYAEGTFFIVWFDLEHKIDPVKLKHT